MLTSLKDKQPGPRVWKHEDEYELELAEVDRIATPATGLKAFEPGAGESTRGLEDPVQRISPELAKDFAEKMHCRLPTLVEWKAALQAELDAELKAEDVKKSVTRWNLRDSKSWEAQATFRRTLTTDNAAPLQPDGWELITGRKAPDQSWKGNAAGASLAPLDNPYDDGHLWFQSVNGDKDPTSKYGNVGRGALFLHAGRAGEQHNPI